MFFVFELLQLTLNIRFQFLEVINKRQSLQSQLNLQVISMSHLPEHVLHTFTQIESIVKLILNEADTSNNDEDREPNDKPTTELKIERKQAVELEEKPKDTITVETDSKKDLEAKTIASQDAIDNFVRTQARRLKVLYPNFTDQEITTAANKFWNELPEDQKAHLCAKFEHNTKVDIQPIIKTQQIVQEQQIPNETNPSQPQIEIQNEPASSLPTDPSLVTATTITTSTHQTQQIGSNLPTTQQTSPQASTNANISEDHICNQEKVQKYILVSCKENTNNGEQTDGQNNIITVLMSQKQDKQQQSSLKVIILQTCQSQLIQEQHTEIADTQPQTEQKHESEQQKEGVQESQQ